MAPPTEFPCKLSVSIPLPSVSHASIALRAITIDAELSPLVTRTLSIDPSNASILRVDYAATTNRMLRVAVNGFFDSLGVVLGIMEECDEDTVMFPGKESVEGAQGLAEAKV